MRWLVKVRQGHAPYRHPELPVAARCQRRPSLPRPGLACGQGCMKCVCECLVVWLPCLSRRIWSPAAGVCKHAPAWQPQELEKTDTLMAVAPDGASLVLLRLSDSRLW